MNEELIKNLKKLMNDNETPENINNSLVYIYKQDIKEIYDCLMGVDLFKLFKIKANIENDTKLIGLIKLLLSKPVKLIILPILTGGITNILINTLNEKYNQYKQYIFIFLGLILCIVFLYIICYLRKKIKTKSPSFMEFFMIVDLVIEIKKEELKNGQNEDYNKYKFVNTRNQVRIKKRKISIVNSL